MIPPEGLEFFPRRAVFIQLVIHLIREWKAPPDRVGALLLTDAVPLYIVVVAVHRKRGVAPNRIRELVANLVIGDLLVVPRPSREDVLEVCDNRFEFTILVLGKPHHHPGEVVQVLSDWLFLVEAFGHIRHTGEFE